MLQVEELRLEDGVVVLVRRLVEHVDRRGPQILTTFSRSMNSSVEARRR